MLIVMSDLHLAESESNRLGSLQYNHNLPAVVYRAYFKEIADLIREDRVGMIDLVLAGDTFETTRSALWLRDGLRPYIDNIEVDEGSSVEERVVEILDAIEADARASETLEIFRGLENLFQRPVRIHFIPGNHDRLVNATPKIRQRVQRLLGLPINDSPFMNQYIHYVRGEASVLVRHGHEYDPNNFGENLKSWESIPTFIDKAAYDKPVFGDITTIELAAKLPQLFKEYYSEGTVLASEELVLLYRRLMDFDNVRPANALMNFLFSTAGMSQQDVWKFIEPVIIKAFDEIALDENLSENIKELGGMAGFSVGTINRLINTRLWKKGIPFWAIERLLGSLSWKIKPDSLIDVIKKEQCYQPESSSIQCVVSGHTHNPQVELVEVDNEQQKYYINCGTFRNVITSTPELNHFGRLRSKARVLIFERGEQNQEYTRETGWSFDFTAKYGFGSEPDPD